MAAQARSRRWLQDEPKFDMRGLLRLAMWGAAAGAALTLVVLSAYSAPGSQRLRITSGTGRTDAERPPQPAATQIVPRLAEAENETRRLSNAVQVLTADRDQLLARIASLERALDDVTGSIKPQAAVAVTANPPGATAPDRDTATPPANEPAMLPTPAPAKRVATLPAFPAEPEQAKAKTEFGVDVGGAVNFEGLRVLWNSIRAAHADLFEDLHPRVTARDNPQSHSAELRLIVGPIPSAGAAAELCATLWTARRYCQPGPFEGQQVTLAEPERPTATPQRKSAPTPPRTVPPAQRKPARP